MGQWVKLKIQEYAPEPQLKLNWAQQVLSINMEPLHNACATKEHPL